MEKQRDAGQVSGLCERVKANFARKKIYSQGFDKGFWSKDNYATLLAAGTEQVVLPKKGRHNKEDKVREAPLNFKSSAMHTAL